MGFIDIFNGFMINDRQKNLLKEVVENYIDEAQPVGSKLLADRFSLSSATIRHEMAELETQGFIYQPHTSAGRVPTEVGYKFYLDNFVKPDKELSQKYKDVLNKIADEINQVNELLIKQLAKSLADISGNAILVGFGPNNVFYTGLANLFAQPEFNHSNLVVSTAQVVDHLDEVIETIFNEIKSLEARVGSDNPFGHNCSSILTNFKHDEVVGLMGILGPLRMDYQKNFSLLNYVNQLITKV